jgi:uncharacterized protein YbaP (TraB family)
MQLRLLPWLVVYLVVATSQAADVQTELPTGSSFSTQSSDTMDEVIVTGEWPGPQLWKISKGDHVVWILGTLQPLPKHMTWKYTEVEQVLKHSQQVIGRTNVKPKVSIFGLIPLYLQFRKVSKLQDGQTLKDVLPVDLYQRYRTLIAMHKIHDDDIDKLRPIVAAGRLYQDVIDANDLTGKNDVQDMVFKLADRHDVKVNDMILKVDAPKEILKDAKQLPVSAEVACFEEVVAGLETELDLLRKRASSWARGDVNALRKLVTAQSRTACREAVLSVHRVKEISDQAKSDWINAIADSLNRFPSALALSPVYDLISKDGVLDQLRAAGYQVEGP